MPYHSVCNKLNKRGSLMTRAWLSRIKASKLLLWNLPFTLSCEVQLVILWAMHPHPQAGSDLYVAINHLLGIWALHHSANSPGSSGATGRINHSPASCCYGKSTFFPNCPFWTNFALREVATTPPITEKSAEVVGTSLPCAPPLLIDLVMVGWSFRHPFYLASRKHSAPPYTRL